MIQSDGSQQRQFLRRGEPVAGATLPVDPSIVFDEVRGTLVATQLGSQQATPSMSRQRPRFATARDLDDALLQAIEGKITRKNAWASKDASNLLEGITHTVESTLDSATAADEYSSFAKVATVVEGCSKVWTSRVDSTYQRSNQMVRRLLRNEEGDGGAGSDDEGNGEDGDAAAAGSPAAMAAAERKRKAAQRRAQSARTLALDPSEINLDSKARVALVHTGVSAQFRAITEKFDQGNAQGLLVHNTPIGGAGNLILDVDYAREVGREYSARQNRLSGGSQRVKQEAQTEETRVSAASAEAVLESDLGLDAPLDLPPFPPEVVLDPSTGHSPNSADGGFGGRSSGNSGGADNSTKAEEEAGRPSIRLPSLLLLPHTAALKEEEEMRFGGGIGVTADGQGEGEEGQQRGMPTEAPLFSQQYPHDGGYNDEVDGGDWGGGMDYGDDYDYEENDDSGITGGDANNETLRERVAVEAQHLVSGVAELNAMDGRLFGENRLALEAEDPTSWFPLVEPPTSNLMGGATHKNSELLRLHKEHRLAQQPPPSQLSSTPAAKRVKREKTIAFDLPGELAATTGAAADAETSSASSSFLFGGGGVDSSALKQSTTAAKNVTPLGKELLLGRNPSAVLAFTQSAVQRTKAQEAGLLLAEPPVPGRSIPAYLPHPIAVPAFFQPFSTPLPQWNLLRKSATGCTLALGGNNSAGPSRRVSGVVADRGWTARGGGGGDDDMEGGDDHDSNNNNNNIGGGVEDMPVEFFHGGAEADDDYMGAGGYDDYDYDNNDNIEDPVQQAQAHILSSFERAELARANNHNNNTVSSSSLLPLNGSGKTDFDALELAKVLHAPQAALPSQVDVVKLRQVMWASVGDAVARYPLTQQQQQHRQDEEQRSRRKRNRAEAEGNAAGESSEDLPRFSEVVLPILPQVASISATGTLSPAFLFFSILFLANEHGVMLESVPGLDDLVVRGVIQPVAG